MGRRCTQCGSMMISADELQAQRVGQSAMESSNDDIVSMTQGTTMSRRPAEGSQMPVQKGVPTLTLYNPSLDIRMIGVNGAVIGRRQGPYQQLFDGNMYISGVHAQLIYKPDSGWCILDKHSSNGTRLNQRELQPDVPMSLKAGDIVTLANINLQVSIT